MIGWRSLGPVFVYDMLSLARRWQVYLTRAAFVAALLIGMAIAWNSSPQMIVPVGGTPTIAQMAKIGEIFFYALAGIQLSFILLAAPASAAGSICIDRARGTLLHMMVTDLSDAEMVLGRLGSRLAPVFSLVACGVPVLALAGLLGGIDFGALLGLFVVSMTLAVLGCSLSLAISVKASKTHEVLMTVYFASGLWLLAVPVWWEMSRGTKLPIPAEWFQKLNPFVLVYSPYTTPGFVGLADFAIFSAVVLTLSAALVGWSILRLRRAVVESTGKLERASRRNRWFTKVFPSFPGPTLEGNPVLWREWHRNRPSRLARWLWVALLTVTWALVLWGTYEVITQGIAPGRGGAILFGLMLQLFFGFLMVAATSPTVLAEERTRGSLDILLSTPLTTRSILLAKWWGAYRMVIGLAILPTFVSVFYAIAAPEIPASVGVVRWAFQPVALDIFDRYAGPVCCLADFLASGALIVSIGVALATWINRIGRAVGTSVVVYCLLTIGWPILAETLYISVVRTRISSHSQWIQQSITAISPPLARSRRSSASRITRSSPEVSSGSA